MSKNCRLSSVFRGGGGALCHALPMEITNTRIWDRFWKWRNGTRLTFFSATTRKFFPLSIFDCGCMPIGFFSKILGTPLCRVLEILQKRDFYMPKNFVCVDIFSSLHNINNKFWQVFFGFNGFCNNAKLNIKKHRNNFFFYRKGPFPLRAWKSILCLFYCFFYALASIEDQ